MALRRPFLPRSIVILLTGGALTLASLVLVSGASAAAEIAPTTTCSNSVPNTAGLGLICEVTVVNTITASGGSATVTVRECHGAANDAATCTTVTNDLNEPVTAVDQCNSVLNGGGATIECSVRVTNNFVDISPGATDATVNQCVGSSGGGGIPIICDPVQSTTDATITQCNGSANGGGLVAGSTCTATGTKSSALAVTINQCNGSANGAGALIICSANIANNAVASSPSPAPTAAPTAAPTPTAPTTSVAVQPAPPLSGIDPLVPGGMAFLAALTLIAVLKRYPDRRELR